MKTVALLGLALSATLFTTSVQAAVWTDTGKIINGGFSDGLNSDNSSIWAAGWVGHDQWPIYTNGWNGWANIANQGGAASYGGLYQSVNGLLANTEYKVTFNVIRVGTTGGNSAAIRIYAGTSAPSNSVVLDSAALASQSITSSGTMEFVFNTGSNTSVKIDFFTITTAYLTFDNVVLYQGETVPEPAALGMLTVGGAALLMRRVRR